MDAEKRDALRAIIFNSEWSCVHARETGNGFLTYLLELVLHEARAMLSEDGEASPGDRSASGLSEANILHLRPPKPGRPH